MRIVDCDLMINMHEEICACEVCGIGGSKGKLDVHHIQPRGMGGGNRLDIGWNLIVVCRKCHEAAGENKITKRTLWGIAAEREILRLNRSRDGDKKLSDGRLE